MVKKRKKKINILFFLGLFVILFFLQRYSLYLTTPAPDSEPWILVSDRLVFGWLDIYPKEADSLRFYNHIEELKETNLFQIPLFPYNNPYFFVLLDPAFQKDAFVQEKLNPYLKNNKYEIFEKAIYSKNDVVNLLKKAELIEDPCVFLLIGNLDIPLIMAWDWVKYPIFTWQSDLSLSSAGSPSNLIRAGGGNIYSLQDMMSLEKMDITIHSPQQNQKIQFELHLPYRSWFNPTQILAKTQNLTF